jgi:hypothetical protein
VGGTSPDTWQTNEPQPEPGTGPTSEPQPLADTNAVTWLPVTTLPGINWRATAPIGPTGSGTFTYTGPVTASTIRKIACDADIIPILLGSEGRILDIGRTSRVFPPHIRKALNARDQGCAFPTAPSPQPGARPTTSPTGPAADPPAPTTACSSAPTTTI